MNIVFTCGGTGGHIYPAIAVARMFRERQPDCRILFIGAEDGMENKLVPREGFELQTVQISNYQRKLTPAAIWHNLVTVQRMSATFAKTKRILKDFRPDVIVGTGGYASFPALKMGAKMGVPTAVHESNAVPGLTTKMLEGAVDTIMVGFEESRANYKHPDRVKVTGTPVRVDFLSQSKAQAKRELGIPEDRPLVASVWGSLGAAHMNEIMTDFIVRACAKPFFNLIHSAGKAGYSRMKDALEREKPDYARLGMDVRDYIYDMPRVMAAADLVLCRAGASTLAELTAMGKPAILVPSPNVTNNHQEKNARVLEEAGGAKVMLEQDFTADSLLGLVSELLQRPERLKEMSQNMLGLGVPDATDRIADIVLGLAERK